MENAGLSTGVGNYFCKLMHIFRWLDCTVIW